MMPAGRGRLKEVSTPVGTASEPSGPQRTCVGCRAVVPRAELLRIAAVDGVATPDPQRRLPGRGANVHRDVHCLELAVRRRSLQRSLRQPQLQTEALMVWMQREQV